MRKYRKIIWVLFLFSPAFGSSQERGIRFEQNLSWREVLAKAKTENKYIFLDCYATWCGPCKMMDQNVYLNDTVADFFREKFISVKIQVDTSKGDNSEVKMWYADAQMINKEYSIRSYPSFLFFSPDGNIVHRALGYHPPTDFIGIAADALDPGKQYYVQLQRYLREGAKDSLLMINLLRQTEQFEDALMAERIANVYISALKEDELFITRNIELMATYTKKSSERGFNVFRQSPYKIYAADSLMEPRYSKGIMEKIIYSEEIQPFEKSKLGKPDWSRIRQNLERYDSLGIETLNAFRPKVIFAVEIEPSLIKDPDWKRTLRRIDQKYPYKKGREFVIARTVIYYENVLAKTGSSDCRNLAAAANYYFSQYPQFAQAAPLNEIAWNIFKHSESKTDLDIALSCAKKAISMTDSTKSDDYAEYLDTYANLLYKSGSKDRAIFWEERAALASPQDSSFAEALKKMQIGERTW
jgi:thioredoxin-related protein